MTTTANSTTNNVGTNPTPTTLIASSFARKYYSILSKEPHNLHHFYKDNSVFIRGNEEHEGEENYVGKENINKKIQSLQYHDCVVSISALEAQESVDNGICVTAVGLLSNKGETPKKFVQTFFLARQTDPVGYYVRNDILLYLKDQTSVVGRQVTDEKPKEASSEKQGVAQPSAVQQAPEPKAPVEVPKQATPASPTPVPATATPIVVVPPSIAQLSPAAVHSPVNPQPAQTQQQQPQVQKETQKEVAKEEPKKAEKPVQEKKQPQQEKKQDGAEQPAPADKKPKQQEGKQEGKQQRQPRGQQAPQQPVAQPVQPAKPVVATWATVAAAQNGQPAPPPEVILRQQQELLTQKDEEKHKEAENLPVETSVYVTNLPFLATEQQVRAQFSTYGEIRNVVLRKGFCFIEFGSAEVMRSVIDKAAKDPIVMDTRTLNVEQKKKGGNKGKSDKKENKGPKENKEGKSRKNQQQNSHDSPRNDTKREKSQQANNVNSKQPSEKNANHQPKPKATSPPKQ